MENVTGEKPYLVVSNNRRNRQLHNVLAVRITTSVKPALESIIELSPDDPLVGRVLCDDLIQLWPDEVSREMGALGPDTMRRVDTGLRAALGLS